jgi:HSP20 family protein
MNVRDLIPWHRGSAPAAGQSGAVSPFEALHREIDRVFDDFWRGSGRLPEVFGGAFESVPQVDVTEDDAGFQVTAELPGMAQKEITLDFSDNTLTISGEKKVERDEKKKDYHVMERAHGSFRRAIPFPVEVEADKVSAAFKNGVLSVSLPKSKAAKAKTKRIAIKSA